MSLSVVAIANYTQSVGLSLLIWIICAALSILGSIVYVELATSIAEEGCDYASVELELNLLCVFEEHHKFILASLNTILAYSETILAKKIRLIHKKVL